MGGGRRESRGHSGRMPGPDQPAHLDGLELALHHGEALLVLELAIAAAHQLLRLDSLGAQQVDQHVVAEVELCQWGEGGGEGGGREGEKGGMREKNVTAAGSERQAAPKPGNPPAPPERERLPHPPMQGANPARPLTQRTPLRSAASARTRVQNVGRAFQHALGDVGLHLCVHDHDHDSCEMRARVKRGGGGGNGGSRRARGDGKWGARDRGGHRLERASETAQNCRARRRQRRRTRLVPDPSHIVTEPHPCRRGLAVRRGHSSGCTRRRRPSGSRLRQTCGRV